MQQLGQLLSGVLGLDARLSLEADVEVPTNASYDAQFWFVAWRAFRAFFAVAQLVNAIQGSFPLSSLVS